MKKRLQTIKPGKSQWSTYEDVVLEILRGCFIPDVISEPFDQVTSPKPDYRRDIILPIIADTGFWHYVSIVYGGTLIVTECKNYKDKITPSQVDSTNKYLRRPNVANLGFIFSRKGPNPAAFDTAIDIYRVDKKLLLFFNDNDLEVLSDLQDKPQEASNYVRNIYNGQKVRM